MTEVDVVQLRYKETTEPKFEKYQKSNEKPIIIDNCKEIFGMLYKLSDIGVSACTKLNKREIFNTLMFKVGILHENEYFSISLFQKIKDGIYKR